MLVPIGADMTEPLDTTGIVPTTKENNHVR